MTCGVIFRSLGFRGCMGKPFSMESLRELLERRGDSGWVDLAGHSS